MRWVILLAAAVLAGVAAAGVLWPYARSRQVMLERLADPLEDERRSLLRTLRELEEERSGGVLVDEDYRALRAETERRAVAVLRTLEARDRAGDLASGLEELRATRGARVPAAGATAAGNGGARPGRGPARVVSVALGALALAAVLIPLLSGALRSRDRQQPITGSASGEQGSPGSDALAFFEQRVREHPDDVAARLDLAQRYRDTGDAQGAIDQYLAALQLDPDNAEAHANLGFLVFLAGRPEDGLQAVERALAVDPNYPDALYFRGVILLQGLDRPGEAAESFRAYLEEAPFGSRRSEVEALLALAEGSDAASP